VEEVAKISYHLSGEYAFPQMSLAARAGILNVNERQCARLTSVWPSLLQKCHLLAVVGYLVRLLKAKRRGDIDIVARWKVWRQDATSATLCLKSGMPTPALRLLQLVDQGQQRQLASASSTLAKTLKVQQGQAKLAFLVYHKGTTSMQLIQVPLHTKVQSMDHGTSENVLQWMDDIFKIPLLSELDSEAWNRRSISTADGCNVNVKVEANLHMRIKRDVDAAHLSKDCATHNATHVTGAMAALVQADVSGKISISLALRNK